MNEHDKMELVDYITSRRDQNANAPDAQLASNHTTQAQADQGMQAGQKSIVSKQQQGPQPPLDDNVGGAGPARGRDEALQRRHPAPERRAVGPRTPRRRDHVGARRPPDRHRHQLARVGRQRARRL